jgi:hypothetical protein
LLLVAIHLHLRVGSDDRQRDMVPYARRILRREQVAVGQEDPFIRSIKRSQKIRMRLGGSCDPFAPFPEKPRGMWKRTYERHCAALARVECSRNEKWRPAS